MNGAVGILVVLGLLVFFVVMPFPVELLRFSDNAARAAEANR